MTCALLLLAGFVSARAEPLRGDLPFTVDVFEAQPIRFVPGLDAFGDTSGVHSEDNGRVIVSSVSLPTLTGPVKITAHVNVSPIPKDELEVFDKWDRAGNVRLVVNSAPDIELVKFITPYGGGTSYEADLSHLAPLLSGTCTFRAFIDTWVSPAWTLTFRLTYEQASDTLSPVWCAPLAYVESVTAELMKAGAIERTVTVPAGLTRVMLYYLVSGHCTDGRDADEFQSKDNVFRVDGQVVYRYRPWREDCRRFRDLNPYARRWSDGSWSVDYARSGWCPGDRVTPLTLDLTDHFKAGVHTMDFYIEGIRPQDDQGQYGYWRVSALLIGYR